MGRKYKDGDGKPKPVRDTLSGCCDCGLVHQHVHSIREDGVLMVQVLRDNRATAMVRRHMAKGGRMVPYPASNVYILPLRIQRKRAIKRVENIKIEPGDPNETVDADPTISDRRAVRASRNEVRLPKRRRAVR